MTVGRMLTPHANAGSVCDVYVSRRYFVKTAERIGTDVSSAYPVHCIQSINQSKYF